MMHQYRFLGTRLSKNSWEILEKECHHLISVIRVKIGDVIEVVDGNGHLAKVEITAVKKKNVEFTVLEELKGDDHQKQHAIAIGALKPKSYDILIPILSELGVGKLMIFHQKGSGKFRIDKKLVERLNRQSLQSMKQCKRLMPLEVEAHDAIPFGEFARFNKKLIMDPSASTSLKECDLGESAVFVVGGEAGLSQEEFDLLRGNGFEPVVGSQHVMKATTAAIYVASFLA